jgi:hypothetical protein
MVFSPQAKFLFCLPTALTNVAFRKGVAKISPVKTSRFWPIGGLPAIGVVRPVTVSIATIPASTAIPASAIVTSVASIASGRGKSRTRGVGNVVTHIFGGLDAE